MDVNIEINIKASEEVTNSLLTLAAVLNNAVPIFDQSFRETKSKVVQEPKEDLKMESVVKEITLEEVRSRLTNLSQSGKQAQVKELINGFGVAKLTDIPKEKYSEVMQLAEGI